MKVFITWSGLRSHAAALLMRVWLPDVLQYVDPFVSSEDIAKGRRWLPDLNAVLDEAKFGLVCVTRKSAVEPWVLFEAGVLSGKYQEARVSCLLVGMRAADVKAPLGQFQNTSNGHDDLLKLVTSINSFAEETKRLTDERVRRAFETNWQSLKAALDGIEQAAYEDEAAEQPPQRDVRSIAEETLQTVRNLERRLAVEIPIGRGGAGLPMMTLPEVLAWGQARGGPAHVSAGGSVTAGGLANALPADAAEKKEKP